MKTILLVVLVVLFAAPAARADSQPPNYINALRNSPEWAGFFTAPTWKGGASLRIIFGPRYAS
jgi:hypothetical protein